VDILSSGEATVVSVEVFALDCYFIYCFDVIVIVRADQTPNPSQKHIATSSQHLREYIFFGQGQVQNEHVRFCFDCWVYASPLTPDPKHAGPGVTKGVR